MNLFGKRTIEDIERQAYDYLIDNQRIDCTFDEFMKNVKVFETPSGVYVELYAGASDDTMCSIHNQLLNFTSEDLEGYENATDALICKHERVRYIDAIDAYLLIEDMSMISDI